MSEVAGTTAGEFTRFVAGLPKCELHLHIEGTLEPELKFALAERNGVALEHSTADEVRASYDFDSLASFLTIYYDSMRVLLVEEDFFDLAMAYLTTAAAQRVRHVEMFFDPQAHTIRGVPFATVIDGLHRATVSARDELDVDASLIMCIVRDHPVESAMVTLLASLPYKDRIVGLGLDSDERGHPPSQFAAVFARARAEGYRLTMHCDIDQENSIEHIRQVIEDIGVDRIDHGTNIVERPDLVEVIRERGIGLTCCPVSNGFVTSMMKVDEITSLLRAGVRVTVNSDDPAYFGAYIAENFVALARAASLTQDDLVTLARNSFEIAWLEPADRARFLAEIDAYARVG